MYNPTAQDVSSGVVIRDGHPISAQLSTNPQEFLRHNGINLPEGADREKVLALAEAFKNCLNTQGILQLLKEINIVDVSAETIKAIKNQIYFDRLNSEIREIVRQRVATIHAESASIYDKIKAYGYNSTTLFVIEQLNQAYEQAANLNVAIKDYLMKLGFQEATAEATASEIISQRYFSALHEDIREIVRGIRPEIHAASAGPVRGFFGWLNAGGAAAANSTTIGIIEALNGEYLKRNYGNMKEHLKSLGLTEDQVVEVVNKMLRMKGGPSGSSPDVAPSVPLSPFFPESILDGAVAVSPPTPPPPPPPLPPPPPPPPRSLPSQGDKRAMAPGSLLGAIEKGGKLRKAEASPHGEQASGDVRTEILQGVVYAAGKMSERRGGEDIDARLATRKKEQEKASRGGTEQQVVALKRLQTGTDSASRTKEESMLINLRYRVKQTESRILLHEQRVSAAENELKKAQEAIDLIQKVIAGMKENLAKPGAPLESQVMKQRTDDIDRKAGELTRAKQRLLAAQTAQEQAKKELAKAIESLAKTKAELEKAQIVQAQADTDSDVVPLAPTS